MNRTTKLLLGSLVLGAVAWSGGTALARPADVRSEYELHGPAGREDEVSGRLVLVTTGVDPALGESARVVASPARVELLLRRGDALVADLAGELERRQTGQGWSVSGTLDGQAVSLSLAADGSLTGGVRPLRDPRGTFFAGSRGGRAALASDPGAPGWSALPARTKADVLWRRVQASAYSHRGMPAMESRGALSRDLFDTKAAAVLSLLRRSFDTKGDVRPARHKIFHTFGAVAQVELVPVETATEPSSDPADGVGLAGRLSGRAGGASRGSTAAGSTPADARRYTGVFRSGARGLVRLSLGAGELFYMPGLALKLLVDGGDSLDVLAIPSFAPSKEKELFAPSNAMTNSLQPPSGALEPILELGMRYFAKVAQDPLHRPIEHLAARTADGQAVAAPVAPYALVFRPSRTVRETLAAARASHLARQVPQGDDIRTLLRGLRADTVIYDVYACDTKPEIGPTPGAGERLVARLVTRSVFVASSFGDRELHFVHTGATVAPGTLEKLDRPVATVLNELDGVVGDTLRAANRRIKGRLGLGR